MKKGGKRYDVRKKRKRSARADHIEGHEKKKEYFLKKDSPRHLYASDCDVLWGMQRQEQHKRIKAKGRDEGRMGLTKFLIMIMQERLWLRYLQRANLRLFRMVVRTKHTNAARRLRLRLRDVGRCRRHWRLHRHLAHFGEEHPSGCARD